MVNTTPVIFEAICRGSLNWRVSIDGADVPIPFASRETCIAAAMERARHHHQKHGVTTQVWGPSYGGGRELIRRYLTPPEFDASHQNPKPSMVLREACDQYGLQFPCIWPR